MELYTHIKDFNRLNITRKDFIGAYEMMIMGCATQIAQNDFRVKEEYLNTDWRLFWFGIIGK